MRRREFLTTTGLAASVAATGLESIVAARRAPAFAQGTRLNILRWVDFVPACDVELRRQASEASKALGAEVVFEFINANDLQPRITAAIQSGAGPDVIMMLHNWPHLYANGLVNVTDLGEWLGTEQGAYYAQSEAAAKDGRRWLALPHGIVGLQFAYRKSWLEEVGQTTWPKTLDELRQVGMKLKKKGKPIGQTLGHTFGDAPAWSYPLVWGFGGAEDDTSNNRAFLSGEIAATLNGASIYIAAKRGQDKIKDDKGEAMVKDILHGPIPNGPAGTWAYHVAFSHAVMKYGKNPKLAKDALKWFHGKEQFGKWFLVADGFSVGSTKFWEQSPMWNTIDEPMKIYRQAAAASRMIGYAGPPSAKATEVYSKYILTDMYAKACQGMKAEDAVKWASGELGKIYG